MKKLCGFAFFCFSLGLFTSFFLNGFATKFFILVLSIFLGYILYCGRF